MIWGHMGSNFKKNCQKDRSSFDEITRLTFLINLLHKSSSPKPLIIVIATKSDLEHQRTISTEEGRRLAESLNARYYEVSSLENHHVTRVFQESADMLKYNLLKVCLQILLTTNTSPLVHLNFTLDSPRPIRSDFISIFSKLNLSVPQTFTL